MVMSVSHYGRCSIMQENRLNDCDAHILTILWRVLKRRDGLTRLSGDGAGNRINFIYCVNLFLIDHTYRTVNNRIMHHLFSANVLPFYRGIYVHLVIVLGYINTLNPMNNTIYGSITIRTPISVCKHCRGILFKIMMFHAVKCIHEVHQ